jgi:hypothetical protein
MEKTDEPIRVRDTVQEGLVVINEQLHMDPYVRQLLVLLVGEVQVLRKELKEFQGMREVAKNLPVRVGVQSELLGKRAEKHGAERDGQDTDT